MLKCAFLSLLLVGSTTAQAGAWDSIKNVFVSNEEPAAPTIRVLIVSDAKNSVVEVKGDYSIYDPYKNSRISSRSRGKKGAIQSHPTGLKWGEEFPGVYQVKIAPDLKDTRVVVNGIEYKGALYVYDVDGRISVVNEVDIEDYVASVLSPIFDKPLNRETMNAVAIAARTDAYHLSGNAQNPFWHVDAETVGYQGYAVTKKSNGVDKAVQETTYMVMTQTTPYGGKITPFATTVVTKNNPEKRAHSSSLSVDEVERLAQKGNQADKILAHIFPNTTIGLTHQFGAHQKRDIAELVE